SALLFDFFCFLSPTLRPPSSTLFPYTTLFRSQGWQKKGTGSSARALPQLAQSTGKTTFSARRMMAAMTVMVVRLAKYVRAYKIGDRKSTRLNSSHVSISYAVFCLKKKKNKKQK